MVWYSCDFETDTTHPDSTFVWAVGVMQVGENNTLHTFTRITDFLDFAFSHSNNSIFWFHNLKFDGQFIVYQLLVYEGYCFYTSKYNMPDKSVYALISDTGEWYQLICKDDKGQVLTIQNSLRKLPFKVKDIAKALNLEHLKGEIDYSIYRPEGGELSKEDYDYLYNDVWIVAKALDELFYKNNLNKLTIGSDCIKDFKNRCKHYDDNFPHLDKVVDEYIRKAYKGGYCYKNPNKKSVNNGCTYDYNSMYPSVMHSSLGYSYPYGVPVYYEGCYEEDDKYPLYIQRFQCEFKLKEGYVPTIQIKGGRFISTEYLSESDGLTELNLSCVDLERFYEHYDVWNEVWLGGYKFKAKCGMFDEYIDYWYNKKKEARKEKNPVLAQLAKLFLNNLYGKFGSSLNSPVKVILGVEELENEDVGKLVFQTRNSEGKGIYIPVAVFVTAYARNELLTAIQANFERFCYCDTDSIHCEGSPEDVVGIIKDNYNLGAWKMEGTWSRAKFIRQKTYMEFMDDKNEWEIKACGCPDDLKQYITEDNLEVGLKIPPDNGVMDDKKFKYKLKPKKVKGGVILENTYFTIH